MTPEEVLKIKSDAQDKAAKLAEALNKKVHIIFVETDSEVVVGYLTEPTLRTKLAAINHIANKQIDLAGELILSTCLIKDQSDKRLDIVNAESSDDNDIYASAVLQCNTLVTLYGGEVKKN